MNINNTLRQLAFTAFTAFVMLTGCKESNTTADKTPIAETSLDDLPPDATLNDIKTIYEVLDKDPEYNSFLKLVNLASYFPKIKDLQDVTLFAPTTKAVNLLPEEQYADLKLPQNLKKLQGILDYHIVEGAMDKARIISTIETQNTPLRLKTIQGAYISLMIKDGNLMITDEMANTSLVSEPDMEASNGVIHGIDHVLIPQ